MSVDVATALTLVGIALAFFVYARQAWGTRRRDVIAARAVLLGLRGGIIQGWGEMFFTTTWEGEELKARAVSDYDLVLEHKTYGQIWLVPTAPIEALLGNAAAGDLIHEDVLEAANVALFHMNVFNQLVGQQTLFNLRHLAEIKNPDLPREQRTAIADGAYAISYMLHGSAIGRASENGGWYSELRRSVQANIDALDAELKRSWWTDLLLGAAALLLLSAVVALVYAWGFRSEVHHDQRPRHHQRDRF